MMSLLLERFRSVGMIGIGGSGMCGIAEILLTQGFKVFGSDQNDSAVVQRLKKLGATVRIGHAADWIENVDVMVYSSAVQENNVELRAAREFGMQVIRRAEMLAELMRMRTGIAISGAHGKTTVTSMVGDVVIDGGFDPMVIVGGRLKKLGGSVKPGEGEIMVTEADEYDQSFLKLNPVMVLINNIDNDHIECYGSYDKLKAAFVKFANSVPFYGRVLVNIDDTETQTIIPEIERTVVTYGFSPQSDVMAANASFREASSSFDVVINGEQKGRVNLPMPGKHNITNALGTIAIGHELNIPFEKICQSLGRFAGVHRRFESFGEIDGRLVVTDFGHHPTEITATLRAAKAGWNRRLLTVFQAHLYSRTQMMGEEFGRSMLESDKAWVLPIYPAREQPIEGVTGNLIVESARKLGHKDVSYIEDKDTIATVIAKESQPGDMIMVIGAGNVDQLVPEIISSLEN